MPGLQSNKQRSSIGILPADTAPSECVLTTGIAPQSEENLNAWQLATILQSPYGRRLSLAISTKTCTQIAMTLLPVIGILAQRRKKGAVYILRMCNLPFARQ